MIRLLAWITKRGFYVSMVLSALAVGYDVFLVRVPGGFSSRSLANLFGAGADFALSLAIGRWLTRQLLRRIHQARLKDLNLSRDMFGYFRDHHTLFGWAAIIAATVHGLYFLIVDPRFDSRAITGWLAWLALVVLVGIGLVLDRRIKIHFGRRQIYASHVALAVVFSIAAAVHAKALIAVVLVWAAIAGAAVVLWLTRAAQSR